MKFANSNHRKASAEFDMLKADEYPQTVFSVYIGSTSSTCVIVIYRDIHRCFLHSCGDGMFRVCLPSANARVVRSGGVGAAICTGPNHALRSPLVFRRHAYSTPLLAIFGTIPGQHQMFSLQPSKRREGSAWYGKLTSCAVVGTLPQHKSPSVDGAT